MKPFFAAIALALATSAFGAERPNILWVSSEDNGPELGCYGDTYATSPHIDALAAKGMRYTNAISTAPVCAPARTTIISGMYPVATGSQHMRSRAKMPTGLKMFPQYLQEIGYYCTNNSKEDYNLIKPGQVWDESSNQAHWRDRSANTPFFAVFNHTISHESQIRNNIPASARIHDPAAAPIPAYHPDTPESRDNWAQYYDRIAMMDARVGNNLRELAEDDLDEDTIVVYFGDHGSGMPRSKRWTYNSGLHVPLIVYFPEKWRHLAPKDYQPGGSSDRPVGFVDLAPTMLSLAGIAPPSWMQGHAFAGAFQTEAPEYAYGFRGRMDERYDLCRAVRGRRYHYIRNYNPHRIYGQFVAYMFQTPTTRVWKELYDAGELTEAQSRFWETKPVEELYDLWEDPDEVHNLAEDPEHQDTLEEMRQAQQDWAREIHDLGFLHEWEVARRAGDAPPYLLTQMPELYDFDRVFAAAELGTSQDATRLAEIAALLDRNDSGERYWGALGLLTLGESGVGFGAAYLRRALADESPVVQIVAAEALGRFGNESDTEAALEVLERYINPESHGTILAITALNAVDYLDERAAPLRNQIAALPKDYDKSGAYRSNGSMGNMISKILADLE